MTDASLRSTAQIARHPIHPMLVPIPIVCFIGALITDVTYEFTAAMMWADFSAGLLVVGVIGGMLAAIAGLTDFLGNRMIRAQAPAWPHLLGMLLVLILAIFNVLYDASAAGKAGIVRIGVPCGGFTEASLRDAGCSEVYPGPASLMARFQDSLLAK